MANYKSFIDSSNPVRVEVEGNTGQSAPYSSALLSAVQAIVTAVGAQVSQLPKEQAPTELVVEFGLKATSEGGFAVVLDRSQANFYISAKWGGESGGGGLGGLLPQLPTS